MLRLIGVEQHYAWGSVDEIPRILRRQGSETPVAEYWLGAHPLGDATTSTDVPLSAYIGEHPEAIGESAAERFGGRLPFLLKLLSAGSPLSLQVHPSRAQAEEGFARETLKGIPLTDPTRSYRDDWPKPELLVALTPCDVLVGFRDPNETAELFERLGVATELSSVIGPLRERQGPAGLQEVFLDVLTINRRRHLVDVVLAASVNNLDADGELGHFSRTAVQLDEHFPGDPSILAALMLRPYILEPGEAVALQAGTMHAYLRGTGVEVMGNSDNVLRGGLTKKHIDVDELIQVVTFESTDERVLLPEGSDGLYVFPTNFEEFELWMVQPISRHWIDAPRTDAGRICLTTSGAFELHADGQASLVLDQGEAAFIPAGEQVKLSGQGTMFLAAPGI